MNEDTNPTGANESAPAQQAADAAPTTQTQTSGTSESSATETSSGATTAESAPATQGTTSDAVVAMTTGSIVDKTLDDIKADADKLGGDLKASAEVVVDQKVRHPAHSILDELEQHLSQFDAYAVAALHGFLNRLRQAI